MPTHCKIPVQAIIAGLVGSGTAAPQQYNCWENDHGNSQRAKLQMTLE